MTPETQEQSREVVAVHESGHCCASWLLGERIDVVRIEPRDGGWWGVTTTTPADALGPLTWAFTTLAGGAAARALLGHDDAGDENDVQRVRQNVPPEVADEAARLADRAAAAPRFKRAVAALADVLYERSELSGDEAVELIERSWSEEGGDEMDDEASQHEADVRRLVMIELGAASPPADVDEEARLLALRERLRSWRRDWWRLFPPGAEPREPVRADELPDQVGVSITVGDETRSMVLSRAQVDSAVRQRGYTLTERRDDAGTRFELQRSRSVTRALGTDGKIIEER